MHLQTHPSRLNYVKYTAFYRPDKQTLSSHITGKKGEMTSVLRVYHTLV